MKKIIEDMDFLVDIFSCGLIIVTFPLWIIPYLIYKKIT